MNSTTRPSRRQSHLKKHHHNRGFTLIEVMLVVVVIGIMASFIQFNTGTDPEDTLLDQSSYKFASIFEIASEYGMLNNIELGLVVSKNSYQFLAFDGVSWTEVEDNKLFTEQQLPKGVEIKLSLDDLPIEEPLLFDAETLDEDAFDNDDEEDEDSDDEEDDSGEDDEKKEKRLPQVYILSGGDLTPFSLTFSFNPFSEYGGDYDEPYYSSDDDDRKAVYRVMGIYSVPLTIERLKYEDY
jgi:general secretion pathway protein H